MRIHRLAIYGFGQHEEINIKLQEGINVFYGMNEAGKTTIQQFILQILFGFPQKNQQLPRYEPKKGGKYGGQIVLEDEEFGVCTIERIRGKAGGEVTVHLENGESGGDELLSKILHNYNRQSFEAIFAFSVHPLQHIEKLSEEELSRVLLASGTTGIDQLSALEQKHDKIQKELFKKSGKLPIINKQIIEIAAQEAALKEYKRTLEEYEPAIERIDILENRLAQLENDEERHRQKIQELTKYKQIYPLLKRRKKAQEELSSIRYTTFPVKGLSRLEQLEERHLANEASIGSIRKELNRLEDVLQKEWDEDHFLKVQELLNRDSEWREWQAQIRQLNREIEKQRQSMDEQFQLVGVIQKDEQRSLLEAEVSIQQENQFYHHLKELKHHEEQLDMQQNILDQIQKEIHSLSYKLDEAYQNAPTEQEHTRLKRWQEERSSQSQQENRQSIKGGKQQPAKLLAFGLAVVSLAVVFMFNRTELGFIGLVAAIFIYIAFDRKKTTQRQNGPYAANDAEMREIEGHILQYDQRVLFIEQQLEDKEKDQKAALQEFNDLTIKMNESKRKLTEFLHAYRIGGQFQYELYNELFRLIRQLQQANKQLEMNLEQLQKLERLNADRLQEGYEVCGIACTAENFAAVLNSVHQQLMQEKNTYENAIATKQQLLSKWDELTLLQQSYLDEMKKLYAEAGVDTKEEFYKAGEQSVLKANLTTELSQINDQLSSYDTDLLDLDLSDEEATARLNDEMEHEKSIREEKNALLKERAELIAKTEHLLEDDQYRNQLQLFEQQKAKLNQEAKDWIVSKLISHAIGQTVTSLKDKKLPAVLEEASRFFGLLTNGRYDSLYINSDGYFETGAADGMHYSMSELSQATKEQAYIALRFALAKSLKHSASFPLVMDDPFVHFDTLRIQNMVQLIERMMNGHQILYFTCHERMLDKWSNAKIIHVEELKNERGLTSV